MTKYLTKRIDHNFNGIVHFKHADGSKAIWHNFDSISGERAYEYIFNGEATLDSIQSQ